MYLLDSFSDKEIDIAMTDTNTHRAATLLLACLDDEPDTVTAVLDQAHVSPGGLPGLLSAMTAATLEVILGVLGEDGARKTLNMVLLDVSLDND